MLNVVNSIESIWSANSLSNDMHLEMFFVFFFGLECQSVDKRKKKKFINLIIDLRDMNVSVLDLKWSIHTISIVSSVHWRFL